MDQKLDLDLQQLCGIGRVQSDSHLSVLPDFAFRDQNRSKKRMAFFDSLLAPLLFSFFPQFFC